MAAAESKISDRSNVVTCGCIWWLKAAKLLAKWIVQAGLPIKAIAPQRSPIANKLTVEYYPEYDRQPDLTEAGLDSIAKCPKWTDVLSSHIRVTNSCTYTRVDIYLRYYHPYKKVWETTALYGLGPRQSSMVKMKQERL